MVLPYYPISGPGLAPARCNTSRYALSRVFVLTWFDAAEWELNTEQKSCTHRGRIFIYASPLVSLGEIVPKCPTAVSQR